ncbi:ATPase, AAA-type, core,AAA+ ATPase domain,P-loop containing nucleoside triphosphate hydrolase,ClpA/B [Cinara cedri]|uniref:ATPase, AAA-type, core,AAA+ ATPase domain,P-loop containing nucleoside triphosphate hydrolase,ClpA/B n=1 Tax=Cinara cedri TaxID=506608 RepID=A0A5E4NGI7_9HEMI|nr:ATPase, AAA-type, core,AAA+ ATPase domain,P-loop containing nucleoside triphosphate hydrolase,ClpA/B [Cinara cedri]
MKNILHVEVPLKTEKASNISDLEKTIQLELKNIKPIFLESIHTKFVTEGLTEYIKHIEICEIENVQDDNNIKKKLETADISLDLDAYDIKIYFYKLDESGLTDDVTDESTSKMKRCILPNVDFNGIWESLVFQEPIKEILLQYAQTGMNFARHNVNPNIISYNRLILLHGPPGTGKTSICKALAQKLSIRLGKQYNFFEFIEINSHNLLSKFFSESGSLIMSMFQKIKEVLEYGDSLVFILIDEVESLTRARDAVLSGTEPSDSIRVVNAVLTQLDNLRKYPNVIFLTTSNVTEAIDSAFTDRADIKMLINPPKEMAIYTILKTAIEELIKVKLIINVEENDKFDRPYDLTNLNIEQNEDLNITQKLYKISKESVGLSGRVLKKITFIAHSLYVRTPQCNGVHQFLSALSKAVKYQKTQDANLNKI